MKAPAVRPGRPVVVGFRVAPKDAAGARTSLSIKRFAVLLLKNGLLLAGLLIAAGVSAVTTMRAVLTSQEVVVPSLIDRQIPEAGTIAGRRRLLLRIEGRRHDPKVAPDRVVAQDPVPGARLKTHRSIRVWVSLGPKRLDVPSVEGESLRTGRLSLEQAEVPVKRVVEVVDPAPEGTILVQHPAPGESDPGGDGASLLVSVGPGHADYVMPDLIGRRADEVLESLRRAGLKVADVRYRSYPGVQSGIVLRQTPPAGHRVSPQTAVSLEISRAGDQP
jgi:eukaryotic-like serine/threonine-protein kinase